MNPYSEIVEVEGDLQECGLLNDIASNGVVITTNDGTLTILGLNPYDTDRLLPGISGRVRITIEHI